MANSRKVSIGQRLSILFTSQIATLKKRHVPMQIVDILRGKKDLVLETARAMNIDRQSIPFIPVLPSNYRSYYDLMAMIRNNDLTTATHNFIKIGRFHTPTDTTIVNVMKTPDVPYYIYDVEDGRSIFSLNPATSEHIILNRNRHPLTAAESMALCAHSQISLRRGMWALGSRLRSAPSDRQLLSYVYLALHNDRPIFSCDTGNLSYSTWGAASYGSR